VHAALLSEDESRRAMRLKLSRDRRRFIVARARLRALLSDRVGAPPASLEFAYGANGKPFLAAQFAASGWHFNLSHSGDLAVYALSRTGELGVDVEVLRPLRESDAIAARVFSPRERSAYAALRPCDRMHGFLSCWTRKEALLKALGGALSASAQPLDASQHPQWRVSNFSPAPGFVAALAVHRQRSP
jgi:4'-phosphopantetheinyl transferase